jgi:TonB-linked SusC/RagA family outer membrane protein
MQKLFLIFLFLSGYWAICIGQTTAVTGVVKGEDGSPLIGVSVTIVGTKIGVITDVQGRFKINAPVDKSQIEFRYVGFENQILKFVPNKVLNVVIKEATNSLEEVIVVGYGTSRKVDLSGSVASVKSDVSENRVVMSVSDALKGKVSGVNVSSSDGTPGGSNTINIRGNTSLSDNSSPLYVIDGVVMDGLNVSPGEIESIDILKDASSTAIYGSKGANGVILITTKKGSAKDQVNFYALYGVQAPTGLLDLMDADQFTEKNYFFSMAYTPKAKFNKSKANTSEYEYYSDNEGNVYQMSKNAPYTNQFYRTDPNAVRYNTNWQDVMMRNAILEDYRINLSGSSAKNNYSVMLGSQKQDGIVINSGYKNYSGRFNFNQNIFKNSKLLFNTSFNSSERTGFEPGNLGVIWRMLTTAPIKPENYDLHFQTPEEFSSGDVETNPKVIATDITNVSKGYSYLANIGLTIPIVKDLILRITGSSFLSGNNTDKYFPSKIQLQNANAQGGIAQMYNSKLTRLGSENTLQYTKKNKSDNLEMMIGNSINQRKYRRLTTENDGFALEDLGVWGISEGITPIVPSFGSSAQTSLSFFSRVNYDFSSKYLFKATLRADGSSVFAKNNKWGFFPSAAAAWRINQESWMKDVKSISNLKLRLSWGVSGKEAIGPYASLPAVNTATKTSLNGSTIVPVGYFSTFKNDNLKWESTQEWNLGFDLGLLNEKISVTGDVYSRKTNDLLYQDPIPIYTGFSNSTRNIGSIQNQGAELAISFTPIRKKDLNWNMNLNISKNVSKVLKLGISDWKMISTGWIGNTNQGKIQEGEPLGNWFGYKTNGIWQTQLEIDNAITDGKLLATEGVKPGFVKYVDLNGDGKINTNDAQVIGNGTPDFTGGFSNSFTYKGIGLNFTFQFTIGNDVFNGMNRTLESGAQYYNALAITENRWKPDLYYYDPASETKGDLFFAGNQSNRYPIAVSGKVVPETPIDLWIEDGSFLRLADLTLSYDLPKKVLKYVHIANMKVFATGSNLFVLTNYSGFDPEVNVSSGAGSYLMPGLDYGSYPKARIISCGLNITFQ